MNILTPHLIRLTEDCRRNDYYYANGPKIKIAVSPNDYATLSAENGHHWGLLLIFGTCRVCCNFQKINGNSFKSTITILWLLN